jgi:NAD(P)-dependent dehydrogenase (short-subunit alcohol dehydrogenase family)
MTAAAQEAESAPVAIVTGSSTGIGESIAASLAEDGYTVVVTSRTLERAETAASRLIDRGHSAIPVALDVGDPEQVEAMFTTVDERCGRLDVLVNNAGVGSIGPSESFPLRRWNKVMALNLTGPFLCSQGAAPRMHEHGGVIINIGSIYSAISGPGRAAYATSKHGLIGLTKVLASEWAPLNIRVLAVAPSYVTTDLVQQAVDTGNFDLERTLERTPMKRLGTPEDVAGVVSFLVSKKAGYMTGSVVYVDGGWAGFGGA